jgi:anaerobic magnesium-protoporphyrin IX monomethyl ester cyclase
MIILSHGYFMSEDPKEQQIMKPYVPLGILYISAYLEEHAVEHEVYDTTFRTFSNLTGYLEQKNPRLLGLYTNLMTKLNVLRIMKFVKESQVLKKCRIVLGGPEIRYNAENYLWAGADMLVVGEGEQTFLELSKHFMKNGALPHDLPGTALLTGGQIVVNAERTLIKDLNAVPMPARHKVDLKLYGDAWKKHHGHSMYSISTMRGCPYTCKWCSRAVYGGTYRRRGAELVVKEMQMISEVYHPDRLWFVDDVFTISHKWLREFRDELKKANLSIPYEIITRADRMNDEVIDILKETGCFRVWIGAESGSQRIIDAMDRRVDVKVVGEMIRKTKQKGLEAGTFIMLGYPGEKRSDIKETIRHLKWSDPTQYTITVAYPITGTPLYEEVKATFQNNKTWFLSTDREQDFERGKSSRFYRHALDWVYNEVHYSKSSGMLKRAKFKSRSFLAQALMYIS